MTFQKQAKERLGQLCVLRERIHHLQSCSRLWCKTFRISPGIL